MDPGANRLHVLHALQQRLLEKHAKGRYVVVLVEEAQSMPIATLEEIRLLSNLETREDKLLQIVLFGQPELDEKLDNPSIRQLKERITHGFELEPFDDEETREYVNYRMRQVGLRGRDVFRGNAYPSIAHASQGLTRRINILADKSLLAAYADDTHDVSRRHVKIAIDDSHFDIPRRWGWPEFALSGGILLLAAVVAWVGLESIPPLRQGVVAFWLDVTGDKSVATASLASTVEVGSGSPAPASGSSAIPRRPAIPRPRQPPSRWTTPPLTSPPRSPPSFRRAVSRRLRWWRRRFRVRFRPRRDHWESRVSPRLQPATSYKTRQVPRRW